MRKTSFINNILIITCICAGLIGFTSQAVAGGKKTPSKAPAE